MKSALPARRLRGHAHPRFGNARCNAAAALPARRAHDDRDAGPRHSLARARQAVAGAGIQRRRRGGRRVGCVQQNAARRDAALHGGQPRELETSRLGMGALEFPRQLRRDGQRPRGRLPTRISKATSSTVQCSSFSRNTEPLTLPGRPTTRVATLRKLLHGHSPGSGRCGQLSVAR